MDAKLHQLLLILRGTLARALSDSSEASRAMQQIKRAGWSLYLVVDQQEDEESAGGAALELTTKRTPAEAPAFKIDGEDLTFLRSIGIDPTRSLRRRK